jgi:hypothetical protein
MGGPPIQIFTILDLEVHICAQIILQHREHNYSTNYIKQNYKDAVEILINNNKITLFDKKGNPTKRITYTAKIKFN